MRARSPDFSLSNEQKALFHFAAIKALSHTEECGNATPHIHIAQFLSLSDCIQYAQWLRAFSPIHLTKKQGRFVIRLRKSGEPEYRQFDVASAFLNPFLQIENLGEVLISVEHRFKELSAIQIIQLLSILLSPEKVSIPRRMAVLSYLSSSQLFEEYRDCIRRLGPKPYKVREVIKFKDAILAEWAHRRIESQLDEYFHWPMTVAPMGLTGIKSFNSPENGMLAAFGYHVGKTSALDTFARRTILDDIFSIQLPPLVSAQYMQEWAEPRTPTRLKKLAYTLAALTRNEKRRGLTVAPSERESDFAYLYSEY